MTKTVLVTGATGFIAKHIVLGLLNKGHHVIGSVRSLGRTDEVRDAVRPHLTDTANLDDRLHFVALDLAQDAGWSEALVGVDVLMHTASPFPMTQPNDPQVLIRPAVDGALRALRAAKAAGVDRVIMTSSVASVMSGVSPQNGTAFTEADWSDPDGPGVTAYSASKTLAERAAWDFVSTEAPQIALTTINPGLVVGPALDRHYGTSLQIIERLLAGKDPMLPNFGFNVVDVRDVAQAHIDAMDLPETAGERFILSAGWEWVLDVARMLKATYPDRKITTRKAPTLAVKLLGQFDKAIQSIIPILDKREDCDGSKATQQLGIRYIAPKDAMLASAQSLIEQKPA